MSYNNRNTDRDRDRDRDRDYRPSQQGSRGNGGGGSNYRDDPGRSQPSSQQCYGRGGGGYDDRAGGGRSGGYQGGGSSGYQGGGSSGYQGGGSSGYQGGGSSGYQDRAAGGYQDRGGSSASYQDRVGSSASYQDRGGSSASYQDRGGSSASYQDRGGSSDSYQDRDRGAGSSGAGVCYAFQRGECTRGSTCRFSHEGGSSGGGGPRSDMGGGGRGASGGRYQGRGEGGGGGRGGRGCGGNPHMGSIASVIDLLRSTSLSDQALLPTLCPSVADIQQRVQLIDHSNVVLPLQAEWRLENHTGARVENVKVNHFAVDTRSVPNELFSYSVSVFKLNRRQEIMMSTDRTGNDVQMDLALDGEEKECYFILKTLIDSKPNWQGTSAGQAIGITYDGRKTLFATSALPGVEHDVNENNQAITERVSMPADAPVVGDYLVKLTLAGNNPVLPAGGDITQWRQVSAATIQALDSAPLAFARWGCVDRNSNWLVERSKAFRKDERRIPLSEAYFGMRGYQASLRCSLAGLTLNIDMSVSAFLAGGNMVNLMWHVMGYQSLNDMLHSASGTRGLDPNRLSMMKKVYKNAKCKTTHLRQSKKFQNFGPAANHQDSTFEMKTEDDADGVEMVTVAQYFDIMNRKNAMKYPVLQYPQLPVVNVGGAKRAVYIPCELIDIVEGQTRSKTLDGQMVATMIREAAVRPDDRMRYLSNEDSIIPEIVRDDIAGTFGLAGVSREPMLMHATLLPPAKLMYGDGKILDPGLSGSWNTVGKFAELPPSKTGRYRYGVLFVYDRSLPRDWDRALNTILQDLESDSRLRGLKLECVNADRDVIASTHQDLDKHMHYFKEKDFAIVFAIFAEDTSYGFIKYAADKKQLMTACMSFKKIGKSPRGYAGNVVLKANAKLGGTNHFLASRGTDSQSSSSSSSSSAAGNVHRGNYNDNGRLDASFQRIPASIGWLFDTPCMLMGIDLSHPDPGQSGSSVAAVVASMDGALSQYKCHIAAQTDRNDDVTCLEDATTALLLAFKACNNNQLPRRIIVFRDGVSESQFEPIVSKEIGAIKGALSLLGVIDSIGVAMVVAQKRHNTRMFYHNKDGSGKDGTGVYLNPCPGVCLDATGKEHSITSGMYNEYIINSHVAIQGTAKPCKYTLLYDDFGLKLSELELLTYWSTYMYSRCNKSVSYATPAYYAHWAAKRGKALLTGGARPEELKSLSQGWLDDRPRERTAMYFV